MLPNHFIVVITACLLFESILKYSIHVIICIIHEIYILKLQILSYSTFNSLCSIKRLFNTDISYNLEVYFLSFNCNNEIKYIFLTNKFQQPN